MIVVRQLLLAALCPLGVRVSATSFAQLRGIDRHSLIEAIKEGRIRGYRAEPGGGRTRTGYDIDPDEADEDFANLRCRYCDESGLQCSALALGRSGGCEAHGHVLIGPRAAGVKRPDIGPKISAAKENHSTSLEARLKMSAAKRKAEPALVRCAWCQAKISSKRAGLEKLNYSEEHLERELVRLGLDLLPASLINAGPNFCRPDHAMLWAWSYASARFPQTTQNGKEAWRKAMVDLWRGPHTSAAKNFRSAWKEVLSDPRARRYWLPLWQALENLAGNVGAEKGAAKGREVAAAALTILQRKSAIDKRDLIDLLISTFEGGRLVRTDDGRRRAGRDPEYRKARARTVRALQRGFELLGRPALLAPFV